MQNEKLRSVRKQKKQDKATGKNQPVQEMQKNKVDSRSSVPSTANKELQNTANGTSSVQQNKPDTHDEGAKKVMVYRRLKCVYCGYEMASKAIKPMCSKCWHRKFNEISEFSVIKRYKLKGGVNMAEKKEAEKPEQEKKPVEAEESDEIDAMFD